MVGDFEKRANLSEIGVWRNPRRARRQKIRRRLYNRLKPMKRCVTFSNTAEADMAGGPMRFIAVVAACLLLAACETTSVNLADAPPKPAPDARILIVQPDVELSELQAVGLSPPKADWSTAAQNSLVHGTKAVFDGKGVKYTTLDPSVVPEGRNAQVLRLNRVVSDSITLFNSGVLQLPTHKTGFSWTLGDGAQGLAQAYGADYALFLTARGSYSSPGRVTEMMALAIVGIGIPLGHQSVLATLVDLKTGQIVWTNTVQVSPDHDMRKDDGADGLMIDVLKSAPL